MSKILVTGHRGLLGSACVRRLGLKHEIITFSGDLMDYYHFRSWLDHHRPDAIVHCAAMVGGVKANRDRPVDFMVRNLKIQSTVIESAAFYAVQKLIFIGTSCLYPRDTPTPVPETALLSGPFEPSVEAYATAKLAGYALCKAYARQYGFSYLTAAPCNLYGPKDNYGPSAHVIPALIKRMKESIDTGKPMEVWGDGSATREFMYSDDCADAIGAILDKFPKDDLINLGTGIQTSIKELTDELCKVSGYRPEIIWDNSQPTGIPHKTFDNTKIRSLGWESKVKIYEGLRKTWNDFLTDDNKRLR